MLIFSNATKVKPLPYAVYFIAVFAIAMCGLVVSVYLSLSHYRVYTDIGYASFCAISRAINCDTVSQSPFSIFWGIPVPIWGALGYAFFLLLMPFCWLREAKPTRMYTLLFWIAAVFSCISVLLAFISSSFIESYCLMCIVTYGVNLLLWLYTWIIRRRFSSEGLIAASFEDLRFFWQKKTKTMGLLLSFVVVVILIKVFLPAYWTLAPPSLSLKIPYGITEDGHPWIGAESPKLVITEYADYLCFQCRKMHYYLREIIARYPDKIRLVHHHFPMDEEVNPLVITTFHKGSGKLSLLAIYAMVEGKFWQANDYLYAIADRTKNFNLYQMAEELKIDVQSLRRGIEHPKIRQMLASDIRQGLKMGIIGTPTYVINDRVYRAGIPPEILKRGLE